MAISDTQKVDLLYKKYFGVAKTDLATNKSPSNEAIASPALSRIDRLWTQATSIPATAAATAGIVQAYTGSSAVQCSADTTTTPISSVYPSWKTNLTDWIPSEFGSTYFVQVWVDSSGVGNPTATGTQIFDSGSGGTGEWNFDYSSGVLNFIGGTIPASLTSSKVIYIVGYRYIGYKATNFSNISVGNINISGNTISSTSGNVYINANVTISGNTVNIGSTSLSVVDPIINIHTPSDLTPLTSNDNADIGIMFHYYDYQDDHAFLGRANDTGFLEWYGRGNDVANVFVGTVYGTIKTGGMLLVNTTPATSTSTGALQVAGGIGVAGNIFVGNLYTDNHRFANGVPLTNLTLSNVATYLTAYTGNLSAGNVTANFYGNVYADLITPLATAVTVFNSTTAIGLPVGNNSERPAASAGFFRFNSDSGTVEFYNGTSWIPFQNSISDQQIDPSILGVSQTYALTQVAATEGLLVSINGVVQRPGVAYNVTNYPATTVANVLTLYESVSINDVIDVRYIASATSVTLTGLGEDISTTGNISAGSLTLTSAIQFANLTTAQVNTISAPTRGMTVYNYTSGNIQVYNGTKWANVVLS